MDRCSRRVTIEDRQGIEALFNAADDAWRQQDLQALTTLYDFPIYVGTDDSSGKYQGGEWGTQAWIDPVKGVAYVLMVQRSNFPNSDASAVRREFQQAAARALEKR